MRASLFLSALLLPLAAHAGFDWGAVTSTSSKQQGDVSDGQWERDGRLGGPWRVLGGGRRQSYAAWTGGKSAL